MGEVALDDLQVVAVEPQLEGGPEDADAANTVAQRIAHLLVPRAFDAVLQQAVEDPLQHPLQGLHAAQVDVTADHSVMAFGDPPNKSRQGTLANAALPADKAHPGPAVPRGSHQAADMLDFAAAPHKVLDWNRRSGSKWT